MSNLSLPDGLVAVVRAECPTCQLVVPVFSELKAAGRPLTIYSQDDPDWPAGFEVIDDSPLDVSFDLQIRTVPTLLRVIDGEIEERVEGWDRGKWESLTGVSPLGAGLPDFRPGCGSRTLEFQKM